MIRIVFFLVLIPIFLHPALSQSVAASVEEEAIKEVIEKESEYFWGRDLKNWKKCYVHKPYVVWTSATRDGVTRYAGWETWLSEVKQLFSQSPVPIPYEQVRKYNYHFRIYGDGAWVSFEQEDGGMKTIETRILEKEKGTWKIAMVQVIFNVNETQSDPEGGAVGDH